MPEDRDQLFEKALARHLRGDGESPTSCLDAETLAAYHERMLSPEGFVSAKSHIVSCARCQELLAHLESSEEVAELRETSEGVPAAALMAGGAGRSPAGALQTDRLPENSSDLASASPDRVVAV